VADLKPLRLAGQVVLITGAESGIGRETALRAASEGADIAAVDLDCSGLDSLVEQVRAMGRRAAVRQADVSDARSLALALAPRGIRVNVIAPGLTETPMTRGIPGHIEHGLQAVPLGQLVQASDVAALAVHLMTDEARSVTGSVFSIDGGRTAV
jgi:NAD(P)-dependent dehydrogenase (short-subunit alcohol dehydrogenase family)